VPIYALGDIEPRIDPTAFIHPEAVIIGHVEIGPESSVWPSAVIRGDEPGEPIRIGARTSIQDGVVVHTTDTDPTTVGDECVIGHLAHLEGCIIEDGALVGSKSVVLHRARIGTGALVAAGAVVRNDTIVPPGALALGVPAQIRPDAVEPGYIAESMNAYLERNHRYRAELRRVD
jgi:carbonic anhydrase/acetyltransferase-like protein (isoleucine patch superfamily)